MAKVVKIPETANDMGVKSIVEALRKRNKYKWFGYHLASLLYYQNPDSSLRKSYQNTLYCAGQLMQHDKLLTTHWCKNRWCPACNRNKMGLMINTYGPRLEKEKLWFLTLTRPNVRESLLEDELKEYQAIWQHVQKLYWYKKATKNGLIGIRKVECTYNPQRDDYHPHFHLLLSDREIAKKIMLEWIDYNLLHDCIVNPKAQKLKRVTDNGGYLEIFKYFTKLIAKDGQEREFFDAVHMNVIFEAMRGKRVYFRIGSKDSWGVPEVTDIMEDESAALMTAEEEDRIWSWMEQNNYFGYYEIEDGTGEVLTEMVPPSRLYTIVRNSEGKG